MDLEQLSGRLLFAVPKKGRLHEAVLKLLSGADIQFMRKMRLDIALSSNLPLALIFLPAADIAQFVGEGNVDIGITGKDMVAEANAESVVEILMDLGFGKCDLCVQVPVESPYKEPKDLIGKRVVTSFEVVSKNFFAELERAATNGTNGTQQAQLQTSIRYISGSVETGCALGLADAIVDLVESGDTMRAAGLHSIGVVLKSEAVLICNRKKHNTNPLIETIRRRIQGVIAAQKYVLCNYNITREKLPAARQITPGRKAPTISPLEDEGWIAVQVMILKNTVADIMDKLEAIGARDIMIFSINNCRLD
ncbi:ATP phosphoribosyltransferase [Cladochytrium replicatum]|nr:ATP phosphoribosyltransferase [Cladochytrium replicatum]